MLTGKLVRLRPVEAADLDRYVLWTNDREVTQWVTIRYPVSRQQEQEWVDRAAQQTRPPEITLAIETLAESRHIGSISLHQVSAEDRRAGLGIMIGDKTRWDHGFGTDAILTLLRFAFDEMNLHRVWLEVHDDNARAIACYRKCGFVEEGRQRQDRYKAGAYHDTLVMGVLADEFRALDAARREPGKQS